MGRCEGCQEEETVEHVVLRCGGYSAYRQILRERLKELGVKEFTLKSILGLGSKAQLRVLVSFLKDTGIYWRVWVVADPYSRTVGGGNAPLSRSPTTVKL
ncbi:hypothetical protein AMECASPLE_016513 [Ameca splendens]|uniref:Reverse transcriptase zinc-binding domain-containing protein n=1 Tax=Ameca splendens TaxID=208324 RepID=A0ABV0Z1C3_9TELE